MRRKMLAGMIGLTVLFGLAAGASWADGTHVTFQNGYGYYLQPCPTPLGAQLYPCPRPVPPVVGYTYITYQPLAPHEFLYKHHRTYKVYHSNDRPTRVFVWWH
jgi:hypothetical protein